MACAACVSPPPGPPLPTPGPLPTEPAEAGPTLPMTATVAALSVTIPAGDGATLQAVQYGSGTTAVIFSPMGDCVGDWARLAGAAAAKGMLALTLQWRACGPGGADAALLPAFVDDLRAAIEYVRGQGAERVVLAGASLGGVASAKLLAEAQAAGLVVMAAPADVPSLAVSVSASDLASGVPKLFITAEADAVVDVAQSRALFDLAAEPKEWKAFPGTAHGTHLFATQAGAEAEKYILNFILSFAQ